MDPLRVLPPEILLEVCSLLPAADLARLSELSRGWKDFTAGGDARLWRGVALDLKEALERAPSGDADTLRVLLRAPRLDSLVLGEERDGSKVAQAVTRTNVKQVRRLLGLRVSRERLLLLRRLAPHLDELEVVYSGWASLAALGRMAALRTLTLTLEEPAADLEDDDYEPQL